MNPFISLYNQTGQITRPKLLLGYGQRLKQWPQEKTDTRKVSLGAIRGRVNDNPLAYKSGDPLPVRLLAVTERLAAGLNKVHRDLDGLSPATELRNFHETLEILTRSTALSLYPSIATTLAISDLFGIEGLQVSNKDPQACVKSVDVLLGELYLEERMSIWIQYRPIRNIGKIKEAIKEDPNSVEKFLDEYESILKGLRTKHPRVVEFHESQLLRFELFSEYLLSPESQNLTNVQPFQSQLPRNLLPALVQFLKESQSK